MVRRFKKKKFKDANNEGALYICVFFVIGLFLGLATEFMLLIIALTLIRFVARQKGGLTI